MKILFLSPHKHLISFLESYGDEIIQTINPLTHDILEDIDFIISYGYRHIIKQYAIDKVEGNIINLHISYLPYSRGADPNLWSFLEDTPKGVTIHYLDKGIDTGKIIIQEKLEYDIEKDTLRSTYAKLSKTIEELFMKTWSDIREGKNNSIPQLTYHKSTDKGKYKYLLTDGWDTKIKDIIGKAKER